MEILLNVLKIQYVEKQKHLFNQFIEPIFASSTRRVWTCHFCTELKRSFQHILPI